MIFQCTPGIKELSFLEPSFIFLTSGFPLWIRSSQQSAVNQRFRTIEWTIRNQYFGQKVFKTKLSVMSKLSKLSHCQTQSTNFKTTTVLLMLMLRDRYKTFPPISFINCSESSLREKCSLREFFLVRIFLYLDQNNDSFIKVHYL